MDEKSSAYKEKLMVSIVSCEKKVKGGRNTLFFLAILSLINIVLILINVNISFLFSFQIPSFAVEVCKYISDRTGNQIYLLLSIIGSLFFVGFFFVIFLLSKERRWPGIVALILFITDTLALIVFALLDLKHVSQYLINIAFHVWALIPLINLVRYFPKLNKAKSEYIGLYPIEVDITKPVRIKFFESNPNTIREIRQMDHSSAEYKKAVKSVRLSLGEHFPQRKTYLIDNEAENDFKKQISKNIAVMISSMVLMFVFIIIAALLLPAETAEFNKNEIIIFVCFIIIEIATLTSMIFYLNNYLRVLNKYFSLVIDNYKL